MINDDCQIDADDEEALHELLDNHARLVMNVVHEMVTNIDNLDVLYDKLRDLGLFHVQNQVRTGKTWSFTNIIYRSIHHLH